MLECGYIEISYVLLSLVHEIYCFMDEKKI